MKTSAFPIAEAAAFFAGVMIYIWWLQAIAPYTVVFLLLAMVFSFRQHSETVTSLGLGFRVFRRTLERWWIVWVLLIPTIAWLGWYRLKIPGAVLHGALYFFWCILQQLAYQKMVFDRLRERIHWPGRTRAVSGLLFAIVHVPNPVLVPATFFWGTLSSYLFERTSSVIALGCAQFLLSSLLYLITPLAWNHGFRVGPDYFEFR